MNPGEPIYEVMRLIGADLVEYLRTVRQQIDGISQRVQLWSLAVDGGTIETVFLPRTEPIVDEPSSAVAAYIRAHGLQDKVAAMVYPDRRSSGYGIGRLLARARVDELAERVDPCVVARASTERLAGELVLVEELRQLLADLTGRPFASVVRFFALHAVADRLPQHRVSMFFADEIEHRPGAPRENDAMHVRFVVDLLL